MLSTMWSQASAHGMSRRLPDSCHPPSFLSTCPAGTCAIVQRPSGIAMPDLPNSQVASVISANGSGSEYFPVAAIIGKTSAHPSPAPPADSDANALVKPCCSSSDHTLSVHRPAPASYNSPSVTWLDRSFVLLFFSIFL